MSLRLSLLAGIFAVMLMTVAIGMVAIYWHATAKVETEMQAAVAVGSRITQRAVETIGPPFGGREVVERLIRNFDGDRHVQAVLIGEHGTILEASRPEEPDLAAPEWFQALFAGRPRVEQIELPPVFEGVGTLIIRSSPRNEISEAWEDTARLLVLLAAMTAVTLLLVSWHLSRSLKPLEELSRTFSRAGDAGHLPRVPVRGPEELRQVSLGFNAMAERLELSEARNRRIDQQMVEVQEEERAEIARDLHDEIAPFLFAVDVDASAIEKAARDRGDLETQRQIGAVREAVGRLRRTVRDLLGRLRPAVLLDLGLEHAISHLVAFWRGRHPELTVRMEIEDVDLDDRTSGVAFRIVQESLSNAVRHGQPSIIEITLEEQDNSLMISVADNGQGMPAGEAFGFGLAGMHERVRSIGGRLEVGPGLSGRGVRVLAVLPVASPCRAVGATAAIGQEDERVTGQ